MGGQKIKRKENENDGGEIENITNMINAFNETNQKLVMGFKLLNDNTNNTNKLCVITNESCDSLNEMMETIIEKILAMERNISYVEQMMKDSNVVKENTNHDVSNDKILDEIVVKCCEMENIINKNHQMLKENDDVKKKEINTKNKDKNIVNGERFNNLESKFTKMEVTN